ncbi:MAG: ATP phosphoribosyltransferase [Chloroflexi bacterium]|nr:ATP phosphoribosyltransferase [Chloroflexota bacterium]
MQIKIALPKGNLLTETAALLEQAGWGLTDYSAKARLYRLKSAKFSNLLAKMFHEKDIPIQVAIGNYDLGICGSDWTDELLAKYPSSALAKVKDLGYGKGALYLVASRSSTFSLEDVRSRSERLCIATEYPNLAETLALKYRLRRFSIFPVWGAAEAYPPETADLALVAAKGNEPQLNNGLMPVARVFDSSAFLIANKDSWKSKDLSELVASLYENLPAAPAMPPVPRGSASAAAHPTSEALPEDIISLAIPDGHHQPPTLDLLRKAGIRFDEDDFRRGNHRPSIGLEGVRAKVIRPQDMPLQVANGNFDLAITGKDWVLSHRYQFPSIPVTELVDLKFGRVKIVAVVSKHLPVADVHGLRRFCGERSSWLRVASEYVNIADRYARDNHLGLYRVIPTWGATEAFLPEDADLLIENTETGATIARHDLKIIDQLFESTACLIANKDSLANIKKAQRIESIAEMLRKAVE